MRSNGTPASARTSQCSCRVVLCVNEGAWVQNAAGRVNARAWYCAVRSGENGRGKLRVCVRRRVRVVPLSAAQRR